MPNYRIVNELISKLARRPITEKLAKAMDPGADELEKHHAIHDTLTGVSLTGHPIHPALVHFPIGITAAAAVLELADSRRHSSAITLLSGVAVSMAVPAAVTGVAEWARRRQSTRQRRVGALHATAAEVGTTLASLSLLFRYRNANMTARWMLFGAVAAYGSAGFLGGDLVYGRDVAPQEPGQDLD